METITNVQKLHNGGFAEFALKNSNGKYHVLITNGDHPIISLIYPDVESANKMYDRLNNPSDNIIDGTEDKHLWIDLNNDLGSVGKLHEVSKGKNEDTGKFIVSISSNVISKKIFVDLVVNKMSAMMIIPPEAPNFLIEQ